MANNAEYRLKIKPDFDFAELTKAIQRLNDVLADGVSDANKFGEAIDTASAVDNIEALSQEAVEATKKIDKLGDEAKVTGEEVENAGKKGAVGVKQLGDETNKAIKFMDLLKAAAQTAVAIWAAGKLIDFAKGAAEQLNEIQEATGHLRSIGVDNFDTLTNSAKELSKTTKVSAGEISKSLADMVDMGFAPMADGVVDVEVATANMQASLLLAQSVGGDSAEAMKLLSRSTQVLGSDFGTTAEQADKLYIMMRDGDSDISLLSTSFVGLADKLANIGISSDTAATAFATLNGVWQDGGRSTAALEAFAKAMKKPSKEVEELMTQAGVTAKSFEEDFAGSMQKLKVASENSSLDINELFRNQDTIAMINFYAGEGAEKFKEMGEEIRNAGGASAKAAEEMLTPLDRFNIGMKNIQLMFTEVFASVMPAVMPLIDTLTNTITPLIANIINSLTPMLTEAIGVIAKLIDAIAPIAVELLEPIFEIVAEIIKVVLPIIDMVIMPIKDNLKLIVGILQAVTPIVKFIVGFVGVIITGVTTLYNVLYSIVHGVMTWLISKVASVKEAFDATFGAVAKMFSDIVSAAKKLLETLDLFGDSKKKTAPFKEGMNEAKQATDNVSSSISNTNEELKKTDELGNKAGKSVGGGATKAKSEFDNLAKSILEARKALQLAVVSFEISTISDSAKKQTAETEFKHKQELEQLQRNNTERIEAIKKNTTISNSERIKLLKESEELYNAQKVQLEKEQTAETIEVNKKIANEKIKQTEAINKETLEIQSKINELELNNTIALDEASITKRYTLRRENLKRQQALEIQTLMQADSDYMDKLQAIEIAKHTGIDTAQLERELDEITSKLLETNSLIRLKTAEHNKALYAEQAKFSAEIEDVRLRNIDDINKREYEVELSNAKRIYTEKLILAGKDVALRLAAEEEFQEKKAEIERKYKLSQMPEIPKYAGALIDSFNETAKAIGDVTKRAIDNAEMINSIKKGNAEAEKELYKSYLRREITAGEYYEKLAQLDAETKEKIAANTLSLNDLFVLALSESLKSVADKYMQMAAESALQLSELIALNDTTEAGLAKTAKATAELTQNMAVGFGAAMGSMLASHESFGKSLIMSLLKMLKSAIPTMVAMIFGQSVAANPILGTVLSAGLTATLYGLLALAETAAQGFKDGGLVTKGTYAPDADDVPAKLSRGEFVTNRNTVKALNNQEILIWTNKNRTSIHDWYAQPGKLNELIHYLNAEEQIMAMAQNNILAVNYNVEMQEVTERLEITNRKLDKLAYVVGVGFSEQSKQKTIIIDDKQARINSRLASIGY